MRLQCHSASPVVELPARHTVPSARASFRCGRYRESQPRTPAERCPAVPHASRGRPPDARCSREHRLHDLEHMLREFTGGSVRIARRDGEGHVGKADSSPRVDVPGRRLEFDPLRLVRRPHRAEVGEPVRIRHRERARGAEYLEEGRPGRAHLEAHGDRGRDPARVLQDGADVGVDIDIDGRARRRVRFRSGDDERTDSRGRTPARPGPSKVTRLVR